MASSCPNCGTSFSALYRLRIMNPWLHRCRFCGMLLSVDRKGSLISLGACVLGVGLAALAIAMEEAGLWATRDSLMFFGLCFVVLVPVSAWSTAKFRYVVRANARIGYGSQWPRIMLCAFTAGAIVICGAGLVQLKAKQLDKLPEQQHAIIQHTAKQLEHTMNQDQLRNIAEKSLELQSGLVSLLNAQNRLLVDTTVAFAVLGSLNLITLLLSIVESAKRPNNCLQADAPQAPRR